VLLAVRALKVSAITKLQPVLHAAAAGKLEAGADVAVVDLLGAGSGGCIHSGSRAGPCWMGRCTS
jgi:hypothetical protein